MRSACVIAMVSALGCAAALAGCAKPVAIRDQGVVVGNQGASWETVFTGGDEAPLAGDGDEYARRDSTILTHADEGYSPPDAWPDEGRNRLDDVRRLYLPRNARSITYFSAGPSWQYGWGRWYGW